MNNRFELRLVDSVGKRQFDMAEAAFQNRDIKHIRWIMFERMSKEQREFLVLAAGCILEAADQRQMRHSK